MLAKHPDPTVDHVLKTWAPRMIVQGIDYNDLMTTGERIGTWNDWCREWCATAAGHEAFARKAESEGNRESATEAYLMASMAYHFGCNNSPQNLDEYIPAAKKRVECYAKAAPYLSPPAVRHEVPFEKFRMASYLRVPSGITKPPVVMIISGLESTKEEARTMEEGFLRRGMATFTFDGPGQGESWFQGGLIVEFERATSAVIDYLEQFLESTRAGSAFSVRAWAAILRRDRPHATRASKHARSPAACTIAPGCSIVSKILSSSRASRISGRSTTSKSWSSCTAAARLKDWRRKFVARSWSSTATRTSCQ